MCRPSLYIFLLILIFVAMVAGGGERVLYAQESGGDNPSPMLGLYLDGGYGYRYHALPVFSGSSDCGNFSSGGELVGTFGPEIILPLDTRMGIVGRLLFDVSESQMAESGEPFVITRGEEEVIQFDHEYRLVGRQTAVRMEILSRFSLGERWRVLAGGGVGYVFAVNYEQTDYITDDVYRFAGGAREREMLRNDLDRSGWNVGGILSLGRELPVSSDLMVIPQAALRATNRFFDNSTRNWGVSGAFGLSLIIGSRPEEPPLPAIPLAASINLAVFPSGDGSLTSSNIVLVEVLRGEEGGKWETEQKIYPPELVIDPQWRSSEGIQHWDITFLYDEQSIGTMSSDSGEELSELNWKISGTPPDNSLQRLSVRMSVVDSSGAMVEVDDKVDLRLRRLNRFVFHQENRMIWTFGGEKGELPAEAKGELLEEVIEEADTGDHILIQPRNVPAKGGEAKVMEEIYQLAEDLQLRMKRRGKTLRIDLLPHPEVETDEMYNTLPEGWEIDHRIELIVQKP